ncbi:multicilin [Zonotrichia albicollis]|uniref:multicilin n=1 Tax=Zonotrichia albicollis TaxID=44394 RepID=UPI003D80B473
MPLTGFFLLHNTPAPLPSPAAFNADGPCSLERFNKHHYKHQPSPQAAARAARQRAAGLSAAPSCWGPGGRAGGAGSAVLAFAPGQPLGPPRLRRRGEGSAGAGAAGRRREVSAPRRSEGGRAAPPWPLCLLAGRRRAGRGAEGARRHRSWSRGRRRGRGASMEQGARRRAFGSICPNTVQGPPARPAKKPARPGGDTAWTPPAALSPRAPPPHACRSGASPAPAAPALVLSTINWQDLAASAPTFPTTPAGPVTLQQGPCFQDGPEFVFQEFRDTLGDFIPDVSTLVPPPLDCTDYDFSLGEEVAFGPCTPQLQSSVLVQVARQNLSSPEPCWRDLADQQQKALGDALEANSQLQETLTQRQEELVSLRESNVQLKELASQARQLAAVLDTLMLPQSADGTVLPPLPPLHPLPPPPAAAAAPAGTGSEDAEGVDAMLRAVSEKCRAALRSLGGGAGDSAGGSPGGSPGHSPGGSPAAKRPRPDPRLHGAFRGLRTGRAAPRPAAGQLEGGGSLRAALGEAGAIRTLAFPQGNAFTLRTAAGGLRFRWVPR